MRPALWMLLLVLTPALSWGQTTPPTPGTPGAPQAAQAYTDQEFEPWVLKLRRAEILAVGAFPLVYLFSGLGYDYFYYLSRGFPQDNIPWPAGPGTSQWTPLNQPDQLQQKNLTLVGVSLAVGVALAALDWALGL